MNDNQTQEKKDLLRNIGADLRLVPPKPYKDENNFVKYAGRLADELKSSNNHGVVWVLKFSQYLYWFKRYGNFSFPNFTRNMDFSF